MINGVDRDPTDDVDLRGQLVRRLSVLRLLLETLPLPPPPAIPYPSLPLIPSPMAVPFLIHHCLFAQVEILENRIKCITEYVVNLCPATEEEGDEEHEVSVADSQPDFPAISAKTSAVGDEWSSLDRSLKMPSYSRSFYGNKFRC